MPVGTANQKTERFDLKTLKDGFVELRKFTYGEDLKIQGLSGRMHMDQQQFSRARREAREKGEEPPKVEMTMDVDDVTFFQFSRAIVSHNIEDTTGKPLNFKSRKDFDSLDPNIGTEIDNLISEMNPVEDLKKAEGDGKPTKGPDAPLASVSSTPSTET